MVSSPSISGFLSAIPSLIPFESGYVQEYISCGLTAHLRIPSVLFNVRAKYEIIQPVRGISRGNSMSDCSDRYSCPFDSCARSYTRYHDLKRHWVNIHKQSIEQLVEQQPQDKKPFVCDDCSHTFTRKDTLKAHIAKFHGRRETKEGRFKCPYEECEDIAGFYNVQSLIKHCQEKHNDEFGEVYSTTTYNNINNQYF